MPSTILTDYEQALMNSLRNVFSNPDTQISGCYFHYCQSLMKKTSKLHLRNVYSHDADIKKILKMSYEENRQMLNRERAATVPRIPQNMFDLSVGIEIQGTSKLSLVGISIIPT